MSQLSSQMKLRDRDMVPKILVQAMFTLMALSLLLVSLAVWSGRDKVGTRAPAPIVSSITVTLDATREGTVTVRDDAGNVLTVSDGELNGFIGVIWRVLARERMLQNAPADAPIQVVRRENGVTAVLDPATGTAIELVGYGQDNVTAFARLVP